jgi:DNA-binding transcriptional ArsR family regulator
MQRIGYARTAPEPVDDAQLDAMFMALADPTRRAILRQLTAGEASVTELARPFAMSQPAISKHLKVLERAGLVSRRRDAQRRPCRLEARRLKALTDWLEGYREYWDESYRRLDDLLGELVAEEREGGAADPREARHSGNADGGDGGERGDVGADPG